MSFYMDDTLSTKQAYLAMLKFLEGLYERTHSDDLGGFLGGFQILEDGEPTDAAAWIDWLDAVSAVKSSTRTDP